MNAREQILSAADQLFGEVGFDAASTREIALRSGVNKALIHYHFRSKEGLFLAVLDRYYQRLNQLLAAQLAAGGEFRERMTRLIDVYHDFLAENLNFSRIVQRESSNGKHLARIQGHLAPMFAAAVQMLHRSFPQTRAGELAAHQLLVSFYGMIVSYFTYSAVLHGLTGKDPLAKRELANRKQHLHFMLELVISALEKPPGGKSRR